MNNSAKETADHIDNVMLESMKALGRELLAKKFTIISDEEIHATPNDAELGALVRERSFLKQETKQ